MTFLDTGFLFALVSKKDAHHTRVVEVFQTFRNLRLADHLVTTNHVIAETITLTLRVGHTEAAQIGEQLYAEKLARIHWASPEEERAAFAYFKRHQDQTYSFVDCLSFVVMESLGINEALAVDSDFTHRFNRATRPLAQIAFLPTRRLEARQFVEARHRSDSNWLAVGTHPSSQRKVDLAPSARALLG